MKFIAQQRDPWQPYESNKNKHSVVPEPHAYGLMMSGAVLLAFLMKKYFKGQR